MPARFLVLAFAAALLSLSMAACGDDEPLASNVTATPSLSVPPTASAPTSTASPAPARTGTPIVAVPGTPPPPPPLPSPVPGRVDGTVAPQNAGSTEPVTVKANPDPLPGSALLRDVRAGVHPEEGGWDRIVFEFAGDLPPGSISYVPAVVACGSGAPVSVRGGAVLRVRFDQVAAHDDAGQVTIPRTSFTGSGSTVLEARQICDFEGQVEWAIGVKDRQRFKVTLLPNPRRVVIDIKQ